MKPKINISAVKQQLEKITADYQPPARGKLRVLFPFKQEIYSLRDKGATPAEIAALLAQFEIVVSKDTVARFIRVQHILDKQAKRSRAPEVHPKVEPLAAEAAQIPKLPPRFPNASPGT